MRSIRWIEIRFDCNSILGASLPVYQIQVAAWDQTRRWLFVSGYRQDGDAPLIHVFAVA